MGNTVLDHAFFFSFLFLTSIHPSGEGSMGTNCRSKFWFPKFVWVANSLSKSELLDSWNCLVPPIGALLQQPPTNGNSWNSLLLYPPREGLILQTALLDQHWYPSLNMLYAEFLHSNPLHQPRVAAHMIPTLFGLWLWSFFGFGWACTWGQESWRCPVYWQIRHSKALLS